LLKELRKKIEDLKKKIFEGVVIIDAALIVEWGLQKELDHLIFVKSKREDKIKRLQNQKGYSRKEAMDRIKSQLPEKTKKGLANFVIINDKGLNELKRKAEKIWSKIIKLR
jgi:dephospho-CoA kinase